MTVNEAIQTADRMVKNHYSAEEKVRWLSAVDTLLQRELVERYQGGTERKTEYTLSDMDTELIAQCPYDEMYVFYLLVKIHYFNGEIDLYSNVAEEYNNKLNEFRKWYARNHRDLPTPKLSPNRMRSGSTFSADLFNRAMEAANGYKGVKNDVSAD